MKLSMMIIAGAAAAMLTACADVPADPAARADFDKANDPAEPTNRAIFAANQFVDRNLLKPVARAYADNVPDGVRHSVHNFGSNLGEPIVMVNDLLQGNVSRAWTTTRRFAVDTTVGGVGLFDPATGWGLPYHSADFGQTFGVWGIGTGPSVQLPLLAFSNVRDTVGVVVDSLADPFAFIHGSTASDILAAKGALGFVDRRADLLPVTDSLEKTSLDYYAALRSFAAHRREVLVEQGRLGKEGSSSPDEAEPSAPSATAPPT